MGEKSSKKNNQMGESVGGRIREVRQRRGLTQQELADRLGVSLNTVNRMEMGHRTPGLDVVTRLGELLGCGTEWLITGAAGGGHIMAQDQIPILSSLPEGFEAKADLVAGLLAFPGQPERSFAIQVPDDAMAPFLRSSDYAIFRKGLVTNGQVAVLVDQWGGVRIRRLRTSGDQELFVPENPEHQTFSAGGGLRVVGQVVKGLREIWI